MTDLGGKPHKEWRKDAKKARRKRIRQRLALLRKEREKERERSPTYVLELEKKRLYEEFLLEKETREREEKQKKWLQDEEQAQKKWREEQRLKKLAFEERQKEREKIRKEWEKEQKKIQEQKEKIEALKKEEEKRQREAMEKINDFIYKDGKIPDELLVITESNPSKEMCSFYQKVGSCRFGNQCSRNHHYHKISNVLLFSNFYTHFTLDQSNSSEYDTDINLEYEDSEMYQHFVEFYNDIVPELKKFGEVTMVKVCCNAEIHLRGNVYVEYKTEREAAVACQKFQGRWYAGKQLQIEFVKIHDWGSAVCGDFMRHRCPKGKTCNFLHVFRNPRNEFAVEWNRKKFNTDEDYYEKLRCRNWRWSESPFVCRTKGNSEKAVNGKKSKNLTKRRRSRSSDRRRRKSRSPERKWKKPAKRNSSRCRDSEDEDSKSKRSHLHSNERRINENKK